MIFSQRVRINCFIDVCIYSSSCWKLWFRIKILIKLLTLYSFAWGFWTLFALTVSFSALLEQVSLPVHLFHLDLNLWVHFFSHLILPWQVHQLHHTLNRYFSHDITYSFVSCEGVKWFSITFFVGVERDSQQNSKWSMFVIPRGFFSLIFVMNWSLSFENLSLYWRINFIQTSVESASFRFII